jgi:hypothetical protein
MVPVVFYDKGILQTDRGRGHIERGRIGRGAHWEGAEPEKGAGAN